MASPTVVIVLVGLGLAALICYLYTAEQPQTETFYSNGQQQQKRKKKRSVIGDHFSSDVCSICLQEFNAGDKRRALACEHLFHDVCIDSWKIHGPIGARNLCPNCRRGFSSSI